jgi:hypothetical protein
MPSLSSRPRSVTILRRGLILPLVAAGLVSGNRCPAQGLSIGPTSSTPVAAAIPWPARPPARIYVVPFPMEPGLEQQLQQSAAAGLPQGPLRRMMADRPRVSDMVAGFDRQAPAGWSIAQQVANALAGAGLPVVFWNRPDPPPADGWQLRGEVVTLNDGSAAARGLVGFGAGNKKVGVDVVLCDPQTAGGQAFFVLDTSDKGRMTPGAVPIGAVAGFNPTVMIGRAAATATGISDITQQGRISREISDGIIGAMRQHGQ